MSKFLLALGAAALAITAPAIAQPEGKGGGNKGGGQQKAERGGGNQGGGNAGRGNGGGREMRGKTGNGGGQMSRQGGGNGRGNDQARGPDRVIEKARGSDRVDIARGKGRNDDNVLIVGDDRRDFDRDSNVLAISRNFGGFGGRYDNCPPGLAKKDNGCMPPGQVRKYLGARLQQNYVNSLIPNQYRSWYRDNDDYFYRYGDNNIYRVSRSNNLIDGIIPLLTGSGYGGGYYALGDQFPSSYDFYNVPYQYRSFYGDTSDYRYRYGDGAIYRINSGSGVVDGIVALLAGDLGVGTRLPVGYDTYNVPFAYRDRYADSADNWYRYNDGYIYQVDPKTRLISAVIDAIV